MGFLWRLGQPGPLTTKETDLETGIKAQTAFVPVLNTTPPWGNNCTVANKRHAQAKASRACCVRCFFVIFGNNVLKAESINRARGWTTADGMI